MIRHFFILLLLSTSLFGGHANAFDYSFSARDSIGIERRNNRVYILHKVEADETINSIAERYKVSTAVLQMVNTLNGGTLLIGQIIRIPLVRKYVIVNQPQKEKRIYTVQEGDNLYRIARNFSMDIERVRRLNELSDDVISKGQKLVVEVEKEDIPSTPINDADDITLEKTTNGDSYPAWVFEPATLVRMPIMHQVVKGETLFQISQTNEASVDSLRIWNNLTEENIDVGDRLIVGYSVEKPNMNSSTTEGQAKGKELNINPDDFPRYKMDKGIAALIFSGKNEKPSQQLLCLYNKARVGDYIKVSNPNQNTSAIVKVIGRLSEADQEQKIVIKLNETAGKQLNAINERFPVEVLYNE